MEKLKDISIKVLSIILDAIIILGAVYILLIIFHGILGII